MAISRFSPRALTRGVQIMGDGRQNFLINTLFEAGALHPTDTIDFGKLRVNARVAVYQRAGGPAVPINKSAADAKTVLAPKIREKIVLDENFATVLDASDANYAGPYTDPNSQLPGKVAREQAKLRMRIRRAIELQAAQGLTLGVITITYEDGGTATIDLEFTSATAAGDYSKTILLARTGTDLWSSGSSKPWDLLENMADGIYDGSDYSGPLDVLMGSNAWLAFFNNAKVKADLDNRNLTAGDMNPAAQSLFKGNYNGFGIYKYANGYVNSAGTRVQAFGANKIVMLPAGGAMSGKMTIEYGAVFDKPTEAEQARFIQTDIFSKMVGHEDPPVDEIIVESRPLALIKDPSVIRVCDVLA